MKRTIIKTLPFLLAIAGFTSCLKKDMMNIDPSKSNDVIEFANTEDNKATASSQYPRFNIDLGVLEAGDTANFNINVNYAGADVAPEDITLNLVLDENALSNYNDQDGTEYETPPTSVYKFPASVIIKKGTRSAQIKATITISPDFDFNVNYALPIKIASVSSGTISGNFGTAIYSFAARNQYDGVYSVTGTFSDLTIGPAATATYPRDIELTTYGGNSVAYYDPNLNSGTYGYSFKNAGSGSYYGNFAPVFTFDESGKVTSVTNYYGQGNNGSLRSCEIDPSGINKITFDGSTPAKLGGKLFYDSSWS